MPLLQKLVPRPLCFHLAAIYLATIGLATVPGRSFGIATSPFSLAGVDAMAFALTSSSFPSGGSIDKKFTCDGADISPQLSWSGIPVETKSFALLADDPDAPVGNWNHWVLWNLPAESNTLKEGLSKSADLPGGGQQGQNDFGKTGYNGPCPPPGKPHRYFFKLYALDTRLELKEKTKKGALESAMKGHILGQAEWMGRYGR